MVNIFDNGEMSRKICNIKTSMKDGGLYSNEITLRVKTETGASGYFNRNMSVSYTDTTISGIVEYGPLFNNIDNTVQSIAGDIRITLDVVHSNDFENANQIIVEGIQYRIRSSQPTMFNYDKTYILDLVGQ